jgi:hypothetical protein
MCKYYKCMENIMSCYISVVSLCKLLLRIEGFFGIESPILWTISDFLCFFFVSPFMQIPEYFFRTNHEQFLIHLSKFIFCVIQSLCAKQFMQPVSIAKTYPTWFWCTTAIITEIYFEFGVITFMKAKRVSSQVPPLSLFIIFLSGLTVCNLCAWKYVPGNQWNKYLHT